MNVWPLFLIWEKSATQKQEQLNGTCKNLAPQILMDREG